MIRLVVGQAWQCWATCHSLLGWTLVEDGGREEVYNSNRIYIKPQIVLVKPRMKMLRSSKLCTLLLLQYASHD